MALTKNQKEAIISELRDGVKTAPSAVFVNFHGLGVSDTNAMRRELREQGAVYTVAKKTLLRRALAESGISGDMPDLPGEVAIAYGQDPVGPAGAIAHFAKKHAKNLVIVGGIFEGAFADRAKMEMIAAIPGVQVLRSMFVNVINSPIQGLVVSLSEIAKKKEA
jgi:large subunit ribosomal protein L10